MYLFLDFDGTLTRIRKHPAKVRLSMGTRGAIKDLASLGNVSVAIISGRSLEDITKRVGVKNITYAGNHGLEIKGEDGQHIVKGAKEAKKVISGINKQIKERTASFEGVIVEDKKVSLSVHYRMARKRDIREVNRIVEGTTAPYRAKRRIKLTRGKKVWEIRPPIDWDKGAAVLCLLEKKRKKTKARIVPLYIGDDKTDEDAFRKLKGKGWSVRVAKDKKHPSRAKYYLKGTEEVKNFLLRLYRLKREERRHV